MTEPDPEGGGASQSTQPAQGTSSATDISLREHFEALLIAERRFQVERDRRYEQLRAADQRALDLLKEADDRALVLAAENQHLRDEKANGVLNQLKEERATFPSRNEVNAGLEKIEARLDPIESFMVGQRSATQTRTRAQDRVAPWTVAMGSALMAALVTLLGLAVSGHLG